MCSRSEIALAILFVGWHAVAHAQPRDSPKDAAGKAENPTPMKAKIRPGTIHVSNTVDSGLMDDAAANAVDSNGQNQSISLSTEQYLQMNYELRIFTFWLAVAVLIFGLVVIAFEVWVLMAREKYWDDFSFKLLGLTIIVVSGLFLIVAGYSDKQLSPMMGLLGTTVGYILGRGKQG